MISWLNKLFGWVAKQKQPRIVCTTETWLAGVAELKKRTLNGRQESGAFLLGRSEDDIKRILEFVFYDDIDPNALKSGIVHFSGNKFPILWKICRARGYVVVADVHVHPYGYQQSPSDQENPVIPRQGHYAIIIPNYACSKISPGGIGLYEYMGNEKWVTHTHEGSGFFRLD